MNNPKVSILIANYNNEIFISECINSLRKQTYKNIEIIFFDDFSKDDSIDRIKDFKEVKIIQNIERTEIGSFNQMKAFKEAYKLSNGEIIFLLDSDDYFHEKKIEEVVKFFNENKTAQILFDYPIINKNNKKLIIKKNKKIIFKLWPYIHPTSCISIKKENFESIFETISLKKYPDVWIDFRICLYSKYKIKKINKINGHFTYYRRHIESATSKHTYLSNSWWRRRMQSHSYLIYFLKKEKINFKNNIDYYITKIYNFFI